MDQPDPPFDSAAFLKTLTHRPGVYRMTDAEGRLIYVGKAKDLKKRVSTYFRASGLSHRHASMMERTRRVEVTVTNTEAEALLLENNLIKRHLPRYNVLLRDDKSYPYIHLSLDQAFPRLAFHRGARRGGGRYFGPYASAGAVRDTLNLLQKLFRVRQCEDSFFANRSRPCLQYQIDRCTAPCVGRIPEEDYAQDVHHARQFLEGRSEEVIAALVARMETASAALEFERAAAFRDQIETLRRVSERQYVSSDRGDLDIVACALRGDVACVQVFTIRAGINFGNAAFFPRLPAGSGPGEVTAAFIGQYYLNHEIPADVLVSHLPDDRGTLEAMLSAQRGRRVTVSHGVRGDRFRWLDLARRNARLGLDARLATRSGQLQRLEALQLALGRQEDLPVGRMECFDISHTLGESTVASCVVFEQGEAVKSEYRRFNIEGCEPGDDYAAMEQALTRRYRRLKTGDGKMPDLLLIDGGKGQTRRAEGVLEELQVDGVQVVGVAKGADRRPGLETLIVDGEPRILAPESPALLLIQQIRDEAHRFAITGHRQRRARRRNTSPLEHIPGLGPKRRQSLLKHFGGLRGITRAGVEELSKVPGISARLAREIYDHLHTAPG